MDRLAEQILDWAPTSTLGLDPEGRIVFANRSAAEILGAAAANDLLGQPINTYIQFLGLGSSGEEWCVRDDGTGVWVEYETAAMIEGGRSVGWVVTLRDVSNRRSADRMKDELISVVSHELRTPLTSIRSAVGLLVSGHLGAIPPRGQHMLDIALTNTDRLIRLINDLLDLERVDSGQIRMARVLCDVNDLMNSAADTVRGMAHDAHIALEIGSLDATIPGDPDRLLQVLINLVANAIKFSPATGGTVWLDAEASGAEVVFRVRDAGRGIPADKLESIFDRFAQVDPEDAREKRGTGLGLAISRAIVKQHGGQIWAESTVGAGTTVCVALPMADDIIELERAA
jgi:signal transduction histidine kinase